VSGELLEQSGAHATSFPMPTSPGWFSSIRTWVYRTLRFHHARATLPGTQAIVLFARTIENFTHDGAVNREIDADDVRHR